MSPRRFLPLLAALSLVACNGSSTLSPLAGFGADPQLPAPRPQAIPTVKIAPAVGWPQDRTPVAAPGLAVQAFALGLEHPRWLYVLPNGDVLVAESNAPPKPAGTEGGLRGAIERSIMTRAGAGVPSPDRIVLLRDADGDGTAETRSVFMEGLTSPFGMALIGDRLYVANADAVVVVPYQTGQTRITATPAKVADLPAGRNHHWTKSLVASRDGSRLYVGVGSNSNIGENGLDEEVDRAAILEIDPATGARRVFASGLRNPVGLAWNPEDGRLWVAVNERDALGDDLVPDYMTAVTPGGFYGWPWSYFGQNVDARVTPAQPEKVARAIKPDYALGAHTASLGLTFYTGALVPQWRNGAIIGQHGSWNRNPPSGYKVVFVPFREGRPAGPPQDVLTGFRNDKGEAMGRPVGVAVDARGGLLVADDVGNAVWRVVPASRP
ncbi:sorbosone dehydrogenase family protein [Brevundimonas naejangsanensis]|uniref:Sorbosone dehydrogenase family protein n=1 Tax=Brevundimonas naejangsanensis TaxID=588932 RepID=A0A494RD58_9CAUL|nr:sorbosone dehydrogenase family protein [Brevundimonas naejangsanensis]AYG94225.1 sorbosone dehydrogenase family protein [Brevundimonas naejangsanensis]